jgi:hypothetical protein
MIIGISHMIGTPNNAKHNAMKALKSRVIKNARVSVRAIFGNILK